MSCCIIFALVGETKIFKTYLFLISLACLQVSFSFRWFDLRRNCLQVVPFVAFTHFIIPLSRWVLKLCVDSQPGGWSTGSCSPALLRGLRPLTVQFARLLSLLFLSLSLKVTTSEMEFIFLLCFLRVRRRTGGLVFNCIILFKKEV